jgi:hypothetical protein
VFQDAKVTKLEEDNDGLVSEDELEYEDKDESGASGSEFELSDRDDKAGEDDEDDYAEDSDAEAVMLSAAVKLSRSSAAKLSTITNGAGSSKVTAPAFEELPLSDLSELDAEIDDAPSDVESDIIVTGKGKGKSKGKGKAKATPKPPKNAKRQKAMRPEDIRRAEQELRKQLGRKLTYVSGMWLCGPAFSIVRRRRNPLSRSTSTIPSSGPFGVMLNPAFRSMCPLKPSNPKI